ncbi:TPM domain-containing protein [Actinacidiphila sp. DG2A-62]|uniref:TPM domain-containing protein n=1 Tax=Actinacidiphila sp. DG2A-62 TaxID=3108821 RepID=UPI002DBF75AD|nr:TPM domain-containing protein [Actinacidiphila sp. DG2A-62]MEC3996753.1 TPM domain-containing protein [Actinacidiphila sp. DG2A-62]
MRGRRGARAALSAALAALAAAPALALALTAVPAHAAGPAAAAHPHRAAAARPGGRLAAAAGPDRLGPADGPIPLSHSGQVTDQVGALGDRLPEVRAALARLDRSDGVQLFVAYVDDFSGGSAQDWADATAVKNGLGRKDMLLAVATRARQFAVSADQDSGLTQAQLDEVSDRGVEPALRVNDWAGAAVGAADGVGAVLAGRPVPAVELSPGPADPGGADGGGAHTSGTVWVPVAALAAVLVVGLAVLRRRAAQARQPGRAGAEGWGAAAGHGPKRPTPLTPLPELDAQARHLLVETDDAVRTSREEVGFAAAQFGDEAARPFAEAVEYAEGELTAAFRLRQRLDDAMPENDATRREMLDEILSRCTQANRRLDAESEAFDRLRAMEANADQVLERAEAAAAELPARVAAADDALAELARRYGDAALEPVAGHPAEARDRLEFARTSLEQARAALDADRGRAAVFVRAAESALDQAATLAAAVTRREQELTAADGTLREAVAESEADLAEARAILGGPDAAGGPGGAAGGAQLRGRVGRLEAVLAEVRAEMAQGRYDPLAALRRLEEADSALDAALAGVREQEEAGRRALGLLDQALLAARSEVAAARDLVTTHRGAIGSRARTRLAEAERRLRLAERIAAGGPAAGGTGRTAGAGGTAGMGGAADALEHAREADRLARQAQEYARHDVSGFGGLDGGRRGAGMGGMGGAVLGGILLGDLLGGGRGGGFGGFGGMGGGFGGAPGSFGGGQTRGRMGTGGRF